MGFRNFDITSKVCIFVGLLLVASGLIWADMKLPQQPTEQRLEQTVSDQHVPDTLAAKSFWSRFRSLGKTDDTAYFTFWLAVFTLVLVIVSGVVSRIQIRYLYAAELTASRAADAAKNAADIAKDALVKVQRAFVFIDLFQADMIGTELIVTPKWRNRGTIPTSGL